MLKERIEEEHGSGTYMFCAVVCNGCGRKAVGATPEELAKLTPHWRIGVYGGDDYCPGCLG